MQVHELTPLQWKTLNKIWQAEQEGRAAEIADGLRDFLIKAELILPDMEQHHRITEKARSILVKP